MRAVKIPAFFFRFLLALFFAPVLVLGEPNAGPPLTVAVRSASGAIRRPSAHDGMIDQVGLRPGQTIVVSLSVGAEWSGTTVKLTALDGGEVEAAEGLALDATGAAQFTYTAAALPGTYRFLVVIGSSEYLANFYVLDLDNPQINPPRVRIVD